MENIVLVRLRDSGQSFFYNALNLSVKEGAYVIVEHDRGLDYGQVVPPKHQVLDSKSKEPPKKVIRIAKDNDLKQIEDNRTKSKEAFSTCTKKIGERKLDMKLVRAEYSFDRTKIVFYFTASGRVDFRELVKDLAKIFKARIELRQIGVRDEARLFGGFGHCGRQLCCGTFLKDFLYFEYESYKMMAKGLPKEGEHINTKQGKGKVISVNVFKRIATVVLEDGSQTEVDFNAR
jgi:cell fate regulator YaaT (PSP1 superfamily)